MTCVTVFTRCVYVANTTLLLAVYCLH